jgi:hypothetical protein
MTTASRDATVDPRPSSADRESARSTPVRETKAMTAMNLVQIVFMIFYARLFDG